MYDFEFSYIGESADQDDLNEDFQPCKICVNVEGKQIQGTDTVWIKKVNFNTPETFLESNILDEI